MLNTAWVTVQAEARARALGVVAHQRRHGPGHHQNGAHREAQLVGAQAVGRVRVPEEPGPLDQVPEFVEGEGRRLQPGRVGAQRLGRAGGRGDLAGVQSGDGGRPAAEAQEGLEDGLAGQHAGVPELPESEGGRPGRPGPRSGRGRGSLASGPEGRADPGVRFADADRGRRGLGLLLAGRGSGGLGRVAGHGGE